MSTNFLICAWHHRLWLETFPSKLRPAAKLKAAARLVCSTFKFSDDRQKFWSALPKLRETIFTENLPTAHMGVVANKYRVVMHCPYLITRSWNSQDKSTSYLDATVSKTNEIAITGFKDLNLHELNAYDFSAQNLHYWTTQVSPKNRKAFQTPSHYPPWSLLTRYALTSHHNKLGP